MSYKSTLNTKKFLVVTICALLQTPQTPILEKKEGYKDFKTLFLVWIGFDNHTQSSFLF